MLVIQSIRAKLMGCVTAIASMDNLCWLCGDMLNWVNARLTGDVKWPVTTTFFTALGKLEGVPV